MNLQDLVANPFGRAMLRHTPHFSAYAARALAGIVYPRRNPATRRVEESIAAVFPSGTPRRVRRVARRYRRSQFEYAVEQAHLDLLSRDELRRYCTRQVSLVGGEHLDAALDRPEPIVVFAPHYGNFAIVSLRIAIEARGRKKVHFFFNPPERNAYSARIQRLFRVLDLGVEPIMNDRAGIVKASRALDRGELVGIMPDVAEVDQRSLFVPFFGRLAVAMGGTAHLALRSKATVLPMYAWRVAAGRFVMEIKPPLPLAVRDTMEESVYETTAAIFRNMEQQIAARPEHWMYWDTFPTRVFAGVRLGESPTAWREQLAALQRLFVAGDSELGDFLAQLANRIGGQPA